MNIDPQQGIGSLYSSPIPYTSPLQHSNSPETLVQEDSVELSHEALTLAETTAGEITPPSHSGGLYPPAPGYPPPEDNP